jgi:hypothetical protein
MASFGHCTRCMGHYGMCTDHTACSPCACPPVGWKCPTCGGGVNPDVSRCPCVDGLVAPPPTAQQVWRIADDGQIVRIS